MSAPRAFSREPHFIAKLEQLVAYCEARDQFLSDADLKHALGSLFRGVETDWDGLTALIDFSQALREELGADIARSLLADWSAHAERTGTAKDRVSRAIRHIRDYESSHLFPKALWQRPVREIASTLRPWIDRIGAAEESVAQPWCASEATLANCLEAVENCRLAMGQEQKLKQHPHYDALLRAHWEGPQTSLTRLRSVRDWLVERLSSDGIDLALLARLIPTPGALDRETFEALVREAKELQDELSAQVRYLEEFGAFDFPTWVGAPDATLDDLERKMLACLSTVASMPLLLRWQRGTC